VLFIILAAHSGWALYPVLNKALLAYLPPFTLLMVGNGLALAIAFFVARPILPACILCALSGATKHSGYSAW